MTARSIRLAQYAVAAAVGAVTLVLILLQLSRPVPALVGTNLVPTEEYVVKLGHNRRACQPNQVVPAGTAAVAVTADVRADGRLQLSLDDDALADGKGPFRQPRYGRYAADMIVYRVPTTRRRLDATLCFTNVSRRAVSLAGTKSSAFNLRGQAPSLTVDGHRRDARVAVTFLGPSEQTGLQLMRQVPNRAALFRPAVVGRYLYVALPLLIAAVFFFALRLCLGRDE